MRPAASACPRLRASWSTALGAPKRVGLGETRTPGHPASSPRLFHTLSDGYFCFPEGELVPIRRWPIQTQIEPDTWSRKETGFQSPSLVPDPLPLPTHFASPLLSSSPQSLPTPAPSLPTTFFSITGFNFLRYPLCKNFFPDLITISLNSIPFS